MVDPVDPVVDPVGPVDIVLLPRPAPETMVEMVVGVEPVEPVLAPVVQVWAEEEQVVVVDLTGSIAPLIESALILAMVEAGEVVHMVVVVVLDILLGDLVVVELRAQSA